MVLSPEQIKGFLDEVKDPEVPVLSVVELGVVRAVKVNDSEVCVQITPTYSGCPALHVMESDIIECLKAHGVDNPRIEVVYAPAWTTDWISERSREKLRKYGIAPPQGKAEDQLVPLPSRRTPITCPFCSSKDTALRSEFGSTACKSLHFCESCQQPFEYFKSF